ncbi:hypothetical protein [Pseudomonas sp. Z1-6]|uniref:hypothetical protein n=1 Tax=Pseudomonas sp. Z1-6 TaxID=2817407 RepID=UPI003DA9626A
MSESEEVTKLKAEVDRLKKHLVRHHRLIDSPFLKDYAPYKLLTKPTQDDFDAVLEDLRRKGASIDGDNAYKRDLCDAIVGTLAFGAQDRCPPPEGHWAQRFWDMGRESSANTEELISALELTTDCLSKALTGGEVSAKRAAHALVTSAELLAKQSR